MTRKQGIHKGNLYATLIIRIPIYAVQATTDEYMEQIGDDFIEHAAQSIIAYGITRPTVDEMEFRKEGSSFSIE